MSVVGILRGVWKFLADPKNKNLRTFIIFGLLIMVIFMQRSCNSKLREEIEQQELEKQRIQNNYEAERDNVKQYKINDSTYRAERLAFMITMEELNTKYNDLLVGFEDFKKHPPTVIIKQPLLIKETIKEVPVSANINEDGGGNFSFSSEAIYPDGNYRKLSGNIPFTSKFFSKEDSTFISYLDLPYTYTLNPETGTFELEQRVNLKMGLFQDPETNKIKVAVNTSYPGITFTGLEAYDIMSEDLIKNQLGSDKKMWGIGLNFGYGVCYDYKNSKFVLGPQIGIGLNFTPKWLQW